LISKLAAALREALTAQHASLAAEIRRAQATVAGDATWAKLDPATQTAILVEVGLQPPPALEVSSNEQLARALDVRPLDSWRDNQDAIPQRTARALEAAVGRLPGADPKRPPITVAIRRATLADEAAVRAWVAEHEAKLLEAARKGPVVIG
jgi:hypothetical protein